MTKVRTLAGWIALDRNELAAAWSHHETARAAALEADSGAELGYAVAQQSIILADVGRPDDAVAAAREAVRIIGRRAPARLRAWVAMNEGEVLASAGMTKQAIRRLSIAESLMDDEVADDLPFLMLDERHLARWAGHCLMLLSDAAAVGVLEAALPAEHDSVRAAASLHTDLAIAYRATGGVEMDGHYGTAMQFIDRCQSRRLRARLLTTFSQKDGSISETRDAKAQRNYRSGVADLPAIDELADR